MNDSSVIYRDEQRLIKNTPFELLMLEKVGKEISKKQREREEYLKKLNCKNSWLNSLKSIYSVYFLFKAIGLPAETKISVSLEEFKIAQEQLKKIAEEKVQKFRYRLVRFFGVGTTWHYFLVHGYFANHSRPFGYNKRKVFYDPYLYGYFDHIADRYLTKDLGRVFSHYIASRRHNNDYPFNLEKLLPAVWQKKYGNSFLPPPDPPDQS